MINEPKIQLSTPVRYLKGVGPEKSAILSRLGIETLDDLIYYFPRRYEERLPVKTVSEITGVEKECVRARVFSRSTIRTRGRAKTLLKVALRDPSGSGPYLYGMWFNQPYLSKIFEPKSEIVFYGAAQPSGRHYQMIHPEYEVITAGARLIHMGRITPVYPLTEDLYQKTIRQLVYRTVAAASWLVEDPLPESIRRNGALADLPGAVQQIHFPAGAAAYEAAYRRLVFDEFFLMQLAIQKKKRLLSKDCQELAHRSADASERVERWIRSLEFVLTPGQRSCIDEILGQMRSGRPMSRLVQGDVGSGKTVVAAAGLLFTVANGYQGALMAPTEVLAQQHYFTLTRLLEPLGVSCEYLSGNTAAPQRARILRRLESGDIGVIIGTHSLISSPVRFKRLGLAVIDEQHKFGVFQRASLKDKAGTPAHLLLLSATPIPRSLAMTLYGDLDISTIRQLPVGRQPVQTLWVGQNQRGGIYSFAAGQIAKERVQVFIVCPWISAPAKGDPATAVKSAEALHKEICARFPGQRSGLLHGVMHGRQKAKLMESFSRGELDLMVSTVVIEVGIDVPNATIIIIENAEKFGLSQLHQLRGRVGRGSRESYCFVVSDTTNPESIERLEVFARTADGFEIARKDLQLRGSGDVIGPRQHGLLKLRIGDLLKDGAILELAQKMAAGLLDEDPLLEKAAHSKLNRLIEDRFGGLSQNPSAVVA